MPGTDPRAATAAIFAELPDFPYLAELPGRGVGADLTGRAAALLVGLPVETAPSGWRFAARPGRDVTRAASLLSRDLDELEEAAQGWTGPLKIQVCGPWTLAATIELSRSQNPALADPAAVADLTGSLAEGVAGHVTEIRKRVPGATVVLQLDEPSLPAVMAGAVPTASGLNRITEIDDDAAAARLRAVLSASGGFGVVHCCAPEVPFGVIRASGAGAAGFDLGLLRRADEDGLAEAVEAGLGLLAGVVAHDVLRGRGSGSPDPADAARRITALWRRIGLRPAAATEGVVITPSCGLAGATPAAARQTLAWCAAAARILPELIEEEG
jgi:methionine synthase II (cobalamin-independent)